MTRDAPACWTNTQTAVDWIQMNMINAPMRAVRRGRHGDQDGQAA